MLWIVLPTRNEASVIRRSIDTLRAFLASAVPEPWRIIVADNASTDATRAIVQELAANNEHIMLLALDQPGKGLAIRSGWMWALDQSQVSGLSSQVFSFMDADLATDLRHLSELVATVRGGADIAIGSRFAPGAVVERSTLRHVVSRVNQLLLRRCFGLRVADAPCGFKAVNERVIRELLPSVRDDQWFFDTELLIRAQRGGYRIAEIPVAWREPRADRGSLRKVMRIARENLRAIRALWSGGR